ncbi:LysE family transporter [Bacillus timonensis]|nr:LysE family transporter [Bacillus timonensis]
MLLLLKSILLGFSVSAPVGPIGILCMQRTLEHGKRAGFLTGLGAASANVVYASFAAFSFTLVSHYLVEYQTVLQAVGGLFLGYLGVKIFLKQPAQHAANLKGNHLLFMYLSTFFLMITNPMTIFNFVAMFAGIGVQMNSLSIQSASALVIGVFLGAITWWFILSTFVSLFKKKFTYLVLALINKLAGATITSLGLVALVGMVL